MSISYMHALVETAHVNYILGVFVGHYHLKQPVCYNVRVDFDCVAASLVVEGGNRREGVVARASGRGLNTSSKVYLKKYSESIELRSTEGCL